MTQIEKRENQYFLIENENEIMIEEITKDGKSLILPENESGRKFFALSKFNKSDIHDLIGINRDGSSENHSRKITEIKIPKSHLDLYEKMNDEEKSIFKGFENSISIYMEMIQSAMERINPRKENLTEVE